MYLKIGEKILFQKLSNMHDKLLILSFISEDNCYCKSILFLLITIFTVSDFRDVFLGIVFRNFFSLCKKIVLGLFFKDKNKTNISSQKSKDTYYQTDDNYIINLILTHCLIFEVCAVTLIGD